MSCYVLASNPIVGHVSPVIAVARHLASRGHEVVVVTGSRFTAAIEAAGAEAWPLQGLADFDDRDLDSRAPDREQYSGIRRLRYDVESVFVRPMPDQYRSLQAAVDAHRPDAVLVENAFAGVLPLLQQDASERPPVFGLGVLPLAQISRDAAPFGLGLPPAPRPLGRIRNGVLNTLIQKVVFGPTQKLANELLVEVGAKPIDGFVLDLSRFPDRYLQLTVPEFEYPRSDISANLRFVGPVLPAAAADAALPSWWHELDGSRPVVHVTQGTIDNKDFDRLIRPTIHGLADRHVLVVVSTGGRHVSDLGDLPANVRAAEFLPYDALLPRIDVMVTNAGYGGVQFALSHGVPIVAAGDTEDKPDVSARVAWSGVGVNLRTGTPDAVAVATGVDTVLRDPAYAERARAIAARIAEHDAFATIEQELADAAATRSRAAI